jgi:hypothetical protein
MPTEHNESIPELESPGDHSERAQGRKKAQPGTGDPIDAITDQDIDTAGTDADEQSPTKALGTGTADPRKRG